MKENEKSETYTRHGEIGVRKGGETDGEVLWTVRNPESGFEDLNIFRMKSNEVNTLDRGESTVNGVI